MSSVLSGLTATPSVRLTRGPQGDVLLLSMRNVSNLVAFCLQYEFEDVIASLTGADRIDLIRTDFVERARKFYKALSHPSLPKSLALRATPKIGDLRLDRKYDLFLPIFNNVHEVFAVNAIPGWRKSCRYAACVINETVESDLPRYLLESLAAFDHIYVGSRSIDTIQKITGRPCTYLPMAVDVLAFCPLPKAPPRVIDVLNIGRRSSVTHSSLLDIARRGGFFYYFDTIRMTTGVIDPTMQLTFSVTDPAEHRHKLASLLMRSRYYIANRARANEYSAEFEELSSRFFEGAAAGAIMIGEPPNGEQFSTLFDWPDSVVRTPFDAPDIGDLITELEADPERCTRIRRDSMVNALLRHDWVYRLRTILNDAGVPPPSALLAREARLRELANIAREIPIAP
jgi:hypothetical protein